MSVGNIAQYNLLKVEHSLIEKKAFCLEQTPTQRVAMCVAHVILGSVILGSITFDLRAHSSCKVFHLVQNLGVDRTISTAVEDMAYLKIDWHDWAKCFGKAAARHQYFARLPLSALSLLCSCQCISDCLHLKRQLLLRHTSSDSGQTFPKHLECVLIILAHQAQQILQPSTFVIEQ